MTKALRARFADTKAEFFPDVSPSSEHDAYVLVLVGAPAGQQGQMTRAPGA